MTYPIDEIDVPQPPTQQTKRPGAKLAMASSYIGSSLEMYDFLLYGTAAALVFPQLFFSGVDQGLALRCLLSLWPLVMWHGLLVESSSVISATAWDARRCSSSRWSLWVLCQ